MNNNFQELYKNFNKIKNKGWTKSLRKGPTGIGYTFETLLNKKEDNFQIPDYYGIEIKTIKYFSKQIIHLFTATPDGDTLFPIKRLVRLLGYPDKDYPQYKVLNVTVKANQYTSFGYKNLKLQINWENRKIDLIGYSNYGKTFNLETSWSFEMLEKIFYLKLNYLAIVKACYKKINNEDYFFYNRIEFYKRKNFEDFLKLIEAGIIDITFKIGIWKEKEKLGNIHDRGTTFSISEKDIPLLFNKI